MSEEITRNLVNRLEQIRSGSHTQWYDNGKLDALYEQALSFKKLDKRHQNRAYRIDAKQRLLEMVTDLIDGCPRDLMDAAGRPNAATADTVRTAMAALAASRSLQAQDTAAPHEQREHARDIKGHDMVHVETIHKALHDMREQIQLKRPRVKGRWLGDIKVENYTGFATSFVKAVHHDNAWRYGNQFLKTVPNIVQLARQTECYLAMLEYVHAVDEVVELMRMQPYSLWNDNQGKIEQLLNAASQKFINNIPYGQSTNLHAFNEFTHQNRIIRSATDVARVRDANEHLRSLAMRFISGGEGREGSNKDEPKLFTRILNAYRKDLRQMKAVEAKENKKFEDARNLGEINENAEYFDRTKYSGETTNHIYAARWANAAQHLEGLVKSYRHTLADPSIPTFVEASPHVGEVKPIHKQRVKEPAVPLELKGNISHSDAVVATRHTPSEKGRS
ncbi:MAG: hypothetical protein ACOYNL_03840 [Rickettsiales bacterium]